MKLRRSFATRISNRIIFYLFILMGIMSVAIFYLTRYGTTIYYSQAFHMSMRSSAEYTRRVLSDLHVAINNQAYYIEQSLDRPDELQEIMRRIVEKNNRIHSCGISFVENYYPQKGRWFVPYAVKDSTGIVTTHNLGGPDNDYLNSEWFQKGLNAKKGRWSKPFFDGSDKKPMVAYLLPIHDKTGRTVAVIGADLSLDWMTSKLRESDDGLMKELDNENNKGLHLLRTFITDRDGVFITHPDEKLIMKDTLFSHLKETDEYSIQELRKKLKDEKISNDEENMKFEFDGLDCYVFFGRLNHTKWNIVSVVSWIDLEMPGIVIGILLLMFIAFTLMLLFPTCFLTIRRLAKPLKQLATSANQVAEGNFNVPLPTIKHDDEVKKLRDAFENMQGSLTLYIEELKTTTASKASIENELKIAHDIQMSMLPKTFPPFPERNDIDIYAQLKPAKAVGGDLFDFYINNEELFFCIGDVSGKGVPASLVMAVTRSLFRNISAHTSHPEKIVEGVNDSLSQGNDNNMFVTIFVGVLNLQTGLLRYCNAGHDAPYILDSDVTLLPVDSNLPAGVMGGWNYTVQETTISTGTTIFLYTDGLTEAENISHGQFGEDRIVDMARRAMSKGHNTPEKLIEEMTNAVHNFVGEAEQSDDLTMLAIKRTGIATDISTTDK